MDPFPLGASLLLEVPELGLKIKEGKFLLIPVWQYPSLWIPRLLFDDYYEQAHQWSLWTCTNQNRANAGPVAVALSHKATAQKKKFILALCHWRKQEDAWFSINSLGVSCSLNTSQGINLYQISALNHGAVEIWNITSSRVKFSATQCFSD